MTRLTGCLIVVLLVFFGAIFLMSGVWRSDEPTPPNKTIDISETNRVEVLYHAENNTYCYLYNGNITCVPGRNP